MRIVVNIVVILNTNKKQVKMKTLKDFFSCPLRTFLVVMVATAIVFFALDYFYYPSPEDFLIIEEAGVPIWVWFLGLFGYKTKEQKDKERIMDQRDKMYKAKQLFRERLSKESNISVQDRIAAYKKAIRILKAPNTKAYKKYIEYTDHEICLYSDGYPSGLCKLLTSIFFIDNNLSNQILDIMNSIIDETGINLKTIPDDYIILVAPEFVPIENYNYGEYWWPAISLVNNEETGRVEINPNLRESPKVFKAKRVIPRIEYLENLILQLEKSEQS